MRGLEIHTLGWREALGMYRDVRMARILLIGMMSGLPQVAVFSMLTLWLQESGFSRSDIGLFGLVGLAYAANIAWAPVVDGVRIPGLTRWLGVRRSWIVLMQGLIALCLAMLSQLEPAGQLWWIAFWMVALAAASATQDVAIDALRIEQFRENEPRKVGGGSAMATSGWWIGYGLGGALALWIVDRLQEAGVERAWQHGYLWLIVVVVALVALFLWLVPESRHPDHLDEPKAPPRPGLGSALPTWGRHVARIYAQPVRSFVVRYGLRIAVMLLAAVFLFKVGEAFLGRMSLVFYKEIGFSKSDIALYSKGYGAVAITVFAVLGSLINARYGVLRGLIIGGVAMALTNLLFALLAWYPTAWLFATAVVADQFTTAISTVAFVAFLSQLCDRNWTATQYAVLASLGTLSRTSLAAGSGFLVDGLGGNWPLFFVLTTLMVVPSLLLVLWNRHALAPFLDGRRS